MIKDKETPRVLPSTPPTSPTKTTTDNTPPTSPTSEIKRIPTRPNVIKLRKNLSSKDGEKEIETLIIRLKQDSTVSALYLGSTNLNAKVLKRILYSVKKHSGITEINLTNNKLQGDTDLFSLLLESFPNVEYLNLNQTQLHFSEKNDTEGCRRVLMSKKSDPTPSVEINSDKRAIYIQEDKQGRFSAWWFEQPNFKQHIIEDKYQAEFKNKSGEIANRDVDKNQFDTIILKCGYTHIKMWLYANKKKHIRENHQGSQRLSIDTIRYRL